MATSPDIKFADCDISIRGVPARSMIICEPDSNATCSHGRLIDFKGCDGPIMRDYSVQPDDTFVYNTYCFAHLEQLYIRLMNE